MNDADRGLPLDRVRDLVQVCSTKIIISNDTEHGAFRLTYRAFVAEWMKHVQRVNIALFASPYEVYPSRQILANMMALQSL